MILNLCRAVVISAGPVRFSAGPFSFCVGPVVHHNRVVLTNVPLVHYTTVIVVRATVSFVRGRCV